MGGGGGAGFNKQMHKLYNGGRGEAVFMVLSLKYFMEDSWVILHCI